MTDKTWLDKLEIGKNSIIYITGEQLNEKLKTDYYMPHTMYQIDDKKRILHVQQSIGVAVPDGFSGGSYNVAIGKLITEQCGDGI